MITSAQLIAKAHDWVGVKFLHQGRSRDGADCLGFIAALLSELGNGVFLNNLPENYGRAPQRILLESLTRLTHEIPLQPAALVLIQWPKQEFPSHAGIFTGVNLIHCTEENRKVVEHGFRAPWPKRTASVWALPGVEYLPP
jgi:cell wall-associated NlpC family hydrolase